MNIAPGPKVESTATMRVTSPFDRADLERFLEAVPAEAKIGVTTHTQGQRDPEIVGYTLHARW